MKKSELRKTFKKIAIVGLSASILGVFGYQQNKINTLERQNTTQAAKTKSEKISVGTRYHLGNLNMIVSTYQYKGHVNYVITTNFKKYQYYQVGSNDNKRGETKGVTIAFGNDQR